MEPTKQVDNRIIRMEQSDYDIITACIKYGVPVLASELIFKLDCTINLANTIAKENKDNKEIKKES